MHDLHVWTLTSGVHSMSGHLVVKDLTQQRDVLAVVNAAMRSEFGIEHITIQIEDPGFRDKESSSLH